MDTKTNQPGQAFDLRQVIVQLPLQSEALVQKAATVLVEEVEKRTRLRWPVCYATAADPAPVIALQVADPDIALSAEGFQISTQIADRVVQIQIVGNDAHGLFFGVGYFLRQLQMNAGNVILPQALNFTTAPHYTLRGHQLGYRDKTNAYDGWDLPQWDQYMRELAIFGTNAIELIPPRSDDRLESAHFPLPPLEMMVGMSRIANEYGLAVWIWYPALDEDYARPEMVEFALNEWGEIYRRLPRIDAILVPGGDPGDTRPRFLLPMLAQQTALLKQYHPNAQMWISAQGFSQEWLDEFITILQTETLPWLSGVVYGPWCHMTLQEFRQLIPAQYPVRHYPDITHSLDCQYPVPEWDIAFALTEGRETINPRPRQEKIIFDQMGDAVIGFLTYSEGCNDDVNKFIWSGLGWNPQTDVVEILQQYSRFFIGVQHEDDFTQGLLALEQNWVGPLAINSGVHTTLQQFQALEQSASPALRKNWRFQMALFRAYYDGYVRSRLIYERGLEEQAIDALRQAPMLGSSYAVAQAETILNQAVTQPIAGGWRTRIFQLAEALFQSIHMQLSVTLYAAQSEVRGASLDGIDYPLNDRPWLLAQFQQIRALPDEGARLAAIHGIVTWTDPGPGGYYVDLSNAYDCPYLLDRLSYAADPGFYRSPHRRFPYWKDARPFRRTWRAYTGCLADFPFRLHFPRLDPNAAYQVRVVYSDTEEGIKVRLTALKRQTNGEIEIHPFQLKPFPPQPQTFDIPPVATNQGTLTLSLQREPGLGGLGAGHEICEIWISKKGNL